MSGPTFGGIRINEHQQDLYGYVGHDENDEVGPDPRLTDTMVRASTDRDADRKFFRAFGFVGDSGASDVAVPNAVLTPIG